MIEFNCFQSPIGHLTIFAVKQGVLKISYGNIPFKEIQRGYQSNPDIKFINGIEFTSLGKQQILNYLSGIHKSLDFPIVHINSQFRKKVLETQRKIPYGETKSYTEVAHMINNPKASRSVGSANAQNPLPLYFPCHRIINANGELGRFIWGIEVKQWLLNLETKHH